MKKLIISLLFILATATSVFAMTYDEAKVMDKPIVILFHMQGCSACKQFSPRFDKFASKFSDKFNFVKEDINASTVASTLHFDSVPALYILQPKKNKNKRISDNCAWDDGCFTKTLQNY